jgi:hypothetical protein
MKKNREIASLRTPPFAPLVCASGLRYWIEANV